MIEWKDVTTYSQGDRERKPTCFAAKLGGLRVSVVSSHIYYKGQWVMHCDPFYNTYPLKVESEAEAKAAALELVRREVDKVVAALEEADNPPPN